MLRTAEGKLCRQIDDCPSVQMPLQMTTNDKDGIGNSNSGDDDGGGGGGGGGKEDKGGDTQTTIN